MRSNFIGYYKPLDDEFKQLWENGLFVFDTNVLLDLYRYSIETVNALIDIMDAIKDRIWIPYHVSKEYHKKLYSIIAEQFKKYTKSIETLKDFKSQIEEKRSHPFLEIEQQTEIIEFCEKFDEILKTKQAEIKKLIVSNPVKEKVAHLFDGKLGNSFSKDELEKIYAEGEERYKNNTPPGFLDRKKPIPERYGDLVIWKEILRKNKEIDRPIIFVTRDTKEDWFMNEMGLTISPRPELVEEFHSTKKNLFYCYTTSVFLTYAKKYLQVSIDEKSIGEVEEIVEKLHNAETSNESKTDDLSDDDFIIPDINNESEENTENESSDDSLFNEGEIDS